MRIGTLPLRRKRAAKASRFLVTGGTGFLGSHIAVALLRAGYRVTILARSSRRLSARDRVAQIVDWFGLDSESRGRLDVAEGDILDPGWAAAALGGQAGPGAIDEIVHCASNTAFAERKRAEIEAANVGGLKNVLDFAAKSGCCYFHHVSTAYVAGRRTGLCREDWVESGEFTNVYEETKARGEILAREACGLHGIRLNVYRPSIVYGDSRTGRTLRFNALYFPVKAALMIRDVYLADIRERGGRKAAELGIHLTEGGGVFMPIRVETGAEGGINLVPINHCVDVFMATMEDCLNGGIFHVVNPQATKIEEIVGYAIRLFGLDGVETCGTESFKLRPRNALETLYDSYLDVYRPYMQDLRSFEIENTAPVLETHGLVCPQLNFDSFARCMNYAVETGWGARLFPVERRGSQTADPAL
ncbi:MAG TPA: SDR family oxidoreductase [Armatimonadota bacterium]|jgi:nucleoside-diphosphate-sugar epimerase